MVALIPSVMNVELRPLNRRDRRFYARVYRDPVLMQSIGTPLAPDTALRSAATAISQRRVDCPIRCDWMVIISRRRQRAGLAGWRRNGDTLELGLILLHRWQRQGLAVPVMRRLLERARAMPQVAELTIRHAPGNSAMAAVAHALGFTLREPTGQDEPAWLWILPAGGHDGAGDGVS